MNYDSVCQLHSVMKCYEIVIEEKMINKIKNI